MSDNGKGMLGRISIAIGLALIIAGIGDYAGHLWGRESVHPWFAPLIVIGLGFLLLFPDRLGLGIGWAKEFLPWFKPPEHNRRWDDPQEDEAE